MAELNRKGTDMTSGPGACRPRASRGFSLIEVMIAFTILGVGLLAVAGAQVKAIQGTQSGRHLTQGAIIAQTQIEQLVRSRWTTPVVAGWTAPITQATLVDDGNGVSAEQNYTVVWRFVDLVPNETRTIDVRVTWTEPDGRNRSLATSTILFNVRNL